MHSTNTRNTHKDTALECATANCSSFSHGFLSASTSMRNVQSTNARGPVILSSCCAVWCVSLRYTWTTYSHCPLPSHLYSRYKRIGCSHYSSWCIRNGFKMRITNNDAYIFHSQRITNNKQIGNDVVLLHQIHRILFLNHKYPTANFITLSSSIQSDYKYHR